MHTNLIAMCTILDQVNDIEHGKDRTLGFLPFYHIYGTSDIFDECYRSIELSFLFSRCCFTPSIFLQEGYTGHRHGTIRCRGISEEHREIQDHICNVCSTNNGHFGASPRSVIQSSISFNAYVDGLSFSCYDLQPHIPKGTNVRCRPTKRVSSAGRQSPPRFNRCECSDRPRYEVGSVCCTSALC